MRVVNIFPWNIAGECGFRLFFSRCLLFLLPAQKRDQVDDDDKTGRDNALKKISEGYSVFLWTRFKNEYGLPYKPDNGKKWDLNDAMIWFKKQGLQIPYWDKYFSNDPMDAIDL